jgi:hypothetical protein
MMRPRTTLVREAPKGAIGLLEVTLASRPKRLETVDSLQAASEKLNLP